MTYTGLIPSDSQPHNSSNGWDKILDISENGFEFNSSVRTSMSSSNGDVETKIKDLQEQVALLKQQQQQFYEESIIRERQHAELMQKLRDEAMVEYENRMSETKQLGNAEALRTALASYELEKQNLAAEIEVASENFRKHELIADKVKETLSLQLNTSQEDLENLEAQLKEREDFLELEKKRLHKQVEEGKERVRRIKDNKLSVHKVPVSQLDPRTDSEIQKANAQIARLTDMLTDLRKQTDTQIKAMSREVENLYQQLNDEKEESILRQKACVDLPPGFILWFHANALPRIFALSQEENALTLLEPNDTAPNVYREIPEGLYIKIDEGAQSIAIQANEELESQMRRLVHSGNLTEREFWLHYFSHAHAIKARLADQAWKIAEESRAKNINLTLNTFINLLSQGLLVQKVNQHNLLKMVRLFIRQIEIPSRKKSVPELIYTLNWFSASPDDAWYKFPDIEEEIKSKKQITTIELRDISEISAGRTNKFPPGINSELCFLIIAKGKNHMFVTRAKFECEALVEGFKVILHEFAPQQKKKKGLFR